LPNSRKAWSELGPLWLWDGTLNVRLDTIQKEPDTVQKFVRAVVRGIKALHANPTEAATIAAKEFPTMPLDDLKPTLDEL
jgi:NitT/TauT family transport system substrate-binding protein